MQTYTGWQYLLIDLANQWGMDKDLFEDRIKWVEDNLNNLEQLYKDRVTEDITNKVPMDKRWKESGLYYKAMLAIRAAQARTPIGHLVGFDACCSGIQVMSALTGCVAGAANTGLVNPDVRADAYGTLRDVMAEFLGGDVDVSRKQAKEALMTSFYGSKAKPKEIFGEDTPELQAFYKAAYTIAPGAWELLQDLLASWRPWTLMHQWKLPDGFDARVKVMVKKEARIEVDELDHATFTYEFYENEGTKTGLSNVANVVHSVDAYVLRCIHRRCNYDEAMVKNALGYISTELDARICGGFKLDMVPNTKLAYYVEQFQRSRMADVVILPYITLDNVSELDSMHLISLKIIIQSMLTHKPFPVVTIHDEFKCHANNMNHLRQHYINIFAQLAESRVLSDIMGQLFNTKCPDVKLSPNLGEQIRQSNYALS